jgi:hypothetical protein
MCRRSDRLHAYREASMRDMLDRSREAAAAIIVPGYAPGRAPLHRLPDPRARSLISLTAIAYKPSFRYPIINQPSRDGKVRRQNEPIGLAQILPGKPARIGDFMRIDGNGLIQRGNGQGWLDR